MSKVIKQVDYLNSPGEVGLVKENTFVCPDILTLTSGEKLNGYQLKYESYGKLNKDKDNAIYVCHALTGDHHVWCL